MRKSIVALASAASVFALVSAGATGLNLASNTGETVDVSRSAAIAVTSNICQDTIAVTYNFDETDGTTITGVTLTATPVGVSTTSTCTGLPATVELADASSTPAYTQSNGVAVNFGTANVSTGVSTAVITLDTAYDLNLHKLVQTTITIN